MKRVAKAHVVGLVSVVFSLCAELVPVSLFATVVYSNDFSAGSSSLDGFITSASGGGGSNSVSVVAGQLEVDTYLPIPSEAYAAINNSVFAAPYSSTLKNNPGLVTWAFNVSRENGDGPYNNTFVVGLATSTADPLNGLTSGYIFWGSGGVRNNMYLQRLGSGVPIVVNAPNGLDTLPSKGSVRITYAPTNSRWSVYGAFGSSYVDPTTVTNLLGWGVDSYWTSTPLPFMSLGGNETGSEFFDNVSVSVVPEPATWRLLALGIGSILALRPLRRRSS